MRILRFNGVSRLPRRRSRIIKIQFGLAQKLIAAPKGNIMNVSG